MTAATHQVAPRATWLRQRMPLMQYFVHRTIAWRLMPLALAWSLWQAFLYRSRPWVGDWVMGLTFTTAGFVFVAITAGCVAAYDAGVAVNTDIGAAWHSAPRRPSDIFALWFSSCLPFLMVNAVTLALVMVTLWSDGAAYGQTVAVVAQQWVLLGFASALGVLCGVLQGPRFGSLTALIVGAYLIYWQGYIQRSNVPPLRSIAATAPLIGLKMNERLILIQVAQAAVWIVAALAVATYARRTKEGQRRPLGVYLVAAVCLVVGSGWIAQGAGTALPDPVPVSMPQKCRTASATTVCMYQGHDQYIEQALADVEAVRRSAQSAGLADVLPEQIREVKFVTSAAPGQLGYDGIGGSPTSTRSVLASMLPNPSGCPAYEALAALPSGSPEARLPQVQADATSTLADMLKNKPVKSWVLQPAQLRSYVEALRDCNIANAVRGIR